MRRITKRSGRYRAGSRRSPVSAGGLSGWRRSRCRGGCSGRGRRRWWGGGRGGGGGGGARGGGAAEAPLVARVARVPRVRVRPVREPDLELPGRVRVPAEPVPAGGPT